MIHGEPTESTQPEIACYVFDFTNIAGNHVNYARVCCVGCAQCVLLNMSKTSAASSARDQNNNATGCSLVVISIAFTRNRSINAPAVFMSVRHEIKQSKKKNPSKGVEKKMWSTDWRRWRGGFCGRSIADCCNLLRLNVVTCTKLF